MYTSGSQRFLKQAPLLSSKKSQAPPEVLHHQSICFCSVTTLLTVMGVGRIFSMGGPLGDFSIIFVEGGQKWQNMFYPTRN